LIKSKYALPFGMVAPQTIKLDLAIAFLRTARSSFHVGIVNKWLVQTTTCSC